MDKVEEWNLQPKDYLLPSFSGSKQQSDNKLKEMARLGWKLKFGKKDLTPEQKKVYADRVNFELAVISSSGFSDYFLIVQDFVNKAKASGVRVGPGRGSAAGCLVSYLVGITDIDPLEYGLLFERFLVPGRPSMPDIDVDVSDRDFVINYLEEKYGRDKVSPILNRSEITAKSALIKVSSIFNNYQLGQDLSALITKVRGETPSFAKMLTDVAELQIKKQQYPKIFELAEGLEHTTIGLAGHASGVVISPVPLCDVIPMHRTKGHLYTAYDKKQIEFVKLVKLDILGIDQLTCISNFISLIKKLKNIDIDLDAIPMDDRGVWSLLSRGDTMGVFQFESSLMRDILKQVQPQNMLELAAVNAMGRPGALDADGVVQHYANRKAGLEPIAYAHPDLEPILSETYGGMIYRELAGFTYTEVDEFRKCFSYKDAAIMERNREKFVNGCIAKGYPSELAKSIYSDIEKFAGYGFNKSHAVAYAKVAYWTAWMKHYYPQEYLVACLNTQVAKATDMDDKVKFIIDLEGHGFTILPPDITKSDAKEFTIRSEELDKNGHPVIYYALGAIKGVSQDKVHDWLSLRPFKSLDDAILKAAIAGCNSKNLETLLDVGAFEKLAANTPYIIKTLEERIRKAKNVIQRAKAQFKRQVDKFEVNQAKYADAPDLLGYTPPVPKQPDFRNASIYEYSMDDSEVVNSVPEEQSKNTKVARALREKTHLGFSVSCSLLEEYMTGVRRKADVGVSFWWQKAHEEERMKVAGMLVALDKRPDRSGRKMGFATISDGRSDVRVLIFSHLFSQFQETTWARAVKENHVVVVDGLRSKDALIAKDITFLRKDSDPNEKTKEDSAPTRQLRGLNNPQQPRVGAQDSAKV
jgi:DNA polymerase-3 subunit alpha